MGWESGWLAYPSLEQKQGAKSWVRTAALPSLAGGPDDEFDFKTYIAFVFREKKKKSALFEVSEVIPVMTNNYEENILKGVRDSSYSLESSIELLQKDVVQLHAPRYQSMRRDVIGCTQEMDFILWPRNDIEKIVCLLFSRWKESDEPFRPVQVPQVLSGEARRRTKPSAPPREGGPAQGTRGRTREMASVAEEEDPEVPSSTVDAFPVRAGPAREGGERTYQYWPFSTSDLYSWKTQTRSSSEKPQGLI
ncbi:uncharacterized protein LOC114109663 isoform X2 [Ovis aries]|uniref:uncharacterized protein LOC114109663 isoform X2 n=1 Tax=Ovis aries TaxID=9940 RepID=UPI00295286A5|nr:uncharacterized protein LOC114109663 isoform X2 [Ovis aries]